MEHYPENLKVPTLLVSGRKCRENIRNMVKRADNNGVRFRPHFKTHLSSRIGEWFREEGVSAITVASVSMARYFINHGWKDIIIAFPLNLAEMEDLNSIDPGISLGLLVSSAESAEFLARSALRPFDVWIKTDCGYNRCGIDSKDRVTAAKLLSAISDSSLLRPAGFLSHFGNTYNARSVDQVSRIWHQGIDDLNNLRGHFLTEFPDLEISTGDTPSCSLVNDLSGTDEIRPGNFVFYDAMQVQIGSCTTSQIAVGLICPVVEVHSERQEVIVYGGAVHLSKDYILEDSQQKNYGLVALPEGDSWGDVLDGCFVKSLSQEHGILQLSAEIIARLSPGSKVVIIPVHSCLTVDCMRKNADKENFLVVDDLFQ